MADDHDGERLFEVDPVVVERAEAAPGGPVHNVFRHYDPNQDFLIPPSLDDWLDKNHLARFVAELVDDVLCLSSFLASYKEPRGYPPYDPRLMLKVLLYGYVTGVRSSRALERACRDVVAFRWLAAERGSSAHPAEKRGHKTRTARRNQASHEHAGDDEPGTRRRARTGDPTRGARAPHKPASQPRPGERRPGAPRDPTTGHLEAGA